MQTEDETKKIFNKVLVIGLGQIGFAVASYVKKQREYDVYGYDISSAARDRAELKIGLKNAGDFSGFDIYMVCVSTHNPNDLFAPDTSGLISVANKLSQEGKEGALVVILRHPLAPEQRHPAQLHGFAVCVDDAVALYAEPSMAFDHARALRGDGSCRADEQNEREIECPNESHCRDRVGVREANITQPSRFATRARGVHAAFYCA